MNKPVEARATTLTGAEAVVEMLRAHEVEILFGLCGDTSLPLYDALRVCRTACIRRESMACDRARGTRRSDQGGAGARRSDAGRRRLPAAAGSERTGQRVDCLKSALR